MPLMEQAGLYRRSKAFIIHDLYWTMTDRRWIDRRRRVFNFTAIPIPDSQARAASES